MLKSDVFFVYPPGYSGNYLQWAINVSETSTSENTVKDPLLSDGTTHGFIRTPTHISVIPLMEWMIRNQPKVPQTYIINAFQDPHSYNMHAAYAASLMLQAKPDSIIVNINAVETDDIKFGALNTYTKWPTFFAANVTVDYKFDTWGASAEPTIKDRNFLFNNWRTYFPVNPTMQWEELEFNLGVRRNWFKVRNNLQPWEVNADQYKIWEEVPVDRILDIALVDILDENFIPTVFAPWVNKCNIGEFNWEYAIEYHAKYLRAQQNVQWYESVKAVRNSKTVSTFMLSNSLVQCFLLEEFGNNLHTIDNWQEISTHDIAIKLGYIIE